MEYVVAAVWMIIEVFCMFFSYKSFLAQRWNNTKTILVLLTAGCLVYCIGNLKIYPFYNSLYLQKGTALAVCFFASVVAFNGHWYTHLIAVALFYLVLGAMDTVVVYSAAALLALPVSELIWKRWLYTVVVTVGKALLLFAWWSIYSLHGRERSREYSRKRLLLMFIFPLISIMMLLEIFSSYKNQSDLSVSAVIFSFILIISNLAIINLMNSIERATRAEHELAILSQGMALQTESIQALEKSYRAQRTATHEFKHRLQTIYNLLCTEDSQSAKEYVQQLQAEQTSRIFAVNTKHPVVDAILNEKYHLAAESNIEINIKVNDLSSLKIGTGALVVLLSNLLDNAIEGCQRLSSERIIECTLLLDGSFFMSIRNTSPEVNIVKGIITTSKEPKIAHGYGLVSVHRIIEQLNGEFFIDYADGWFQVVADIPN